MPPGIWNIPLGAKLARQLIQTGSYSQTTSWLFNGAIPSLTSNNLGHANTVDSLDGFGRILQTTDANGVAAKTEYDELGRVIATYQREFGGSSFIKIGDITYHDSSIPYWERTRSFDENGMVQSESINDLNGSGKVTRTWIKDASGSNYYRQDFLHSLRGNLIQSSYSTGGHPNHNAQAALDFTEILTKNYHDGSGNVVESYSDFSNQLGLVVKIPSNDPWQKKTKDASGYTKRLVFNSRGHLIKCT